MELAKQIIALNIFLKLVKFARIPSAKQRSGDFLKGSPTPNIYFGIGWLLGGWTFF